MSEIGPQDDLADTLNAAFALLQRGVADRRCGFRTPSLATVDATGAPRQRIVVLRGFDGAARMVRVHTDRRSAKAGELARDPRVCLLGYDAGARVQIRLTGRATLHRSDGVADAAWRDSQPSSRRCYAAADAPGASVRSPPAAPDDADAGRANFLVLLLCFDQLEWLWLAAEGHRRALFGWRGDAMDATWLAP
jgi:pyridoxamine 5'-phosphate oxidase